LYTKIGLRLGLLLLAAMMLIHVAVFLALQKAMVRQTIAEASAFLDRWTGLPRWDPVDAARLARAECLVRFDRQKGPNAAGDGCVSLSPWVRLQEALQQKSEAIVYYDRGWGVLGPQPQRVALALVKDGKGAAGVWSLESVYVLLRGLQAGMLGYMAVNWILLELIGLLVLGRITAKPLQRLRRRAEAFDDWDNGALLFHDAPETDDYTLLSRSLNRIYGRIKADRQALASAVSRLETANRELRQAQQEMLQAEKLAAVGRLSAGLAHEIGNPLGIVAGYLDLLQQDGISAAERREVGHRAVDEVERIGRILRQLLDLARPGSRDEQIVSVHELIQDTVQVFAYQPFAAGIALHTVLRADRDGVRGHGDRLRQVFLNLMINAADAIRTRNGGAQGELTIRTQTQCGQIHIGFEDNGGGIAEKHLASIFDPFFTTKEPGQGTGLGLAVSYMIVEAFGGKMSVRSREGVGTQMQIELPLA
jgi:signal transduction histidine kinase